MNINAPNVDINAPNLDIVGVPSGVYYGQNERTDELNSRMTSRQFPDSPLQPNFDPRPVSTKYAHFPIGNRRVPANEPILPYIDYNSSANFYPGSANAPVSGYYNKIDVETVLRNQGFALQRGADQNVYVPSSTSDLYQVSVVSRPSEQPHPMLFQQPQFEQKNCPHLANIGTDRFFNHTRTQLRNN